MNGPGRSRASILCRTHSVCTAAFPHCVHRQRLTHRATGPADSLRTDPFPRPTHLWLMTVDDIRLYYYKKKIGWISEFLILPLFCFEGLVFLGANDSFWLFVSHGIVQAWVMYFLLMLDAWDIWFWSLVLRSRFRTIRCPKYSMNAISFQME